MHSVTPDPNASYQACTGFSAAGTDFRDTRLRLDDLIVPNPASTFFLRAEGESELGGCIHAGDILVVDRAAPTGNNSLVVAVVHGELVLRLLVRRTGRWMLLSGRPEASRLEESDFQIWGKVTYVLHPVSP